MDKCVVTSSSFEQMIEIISEKSINVGELIYNMKYNSSY